MKNFYYKNIDGWIADDEALEIYNLALNGKNILEIGFFLGRSTSIICESIEDSNECKLFDSYDMNFRNSTEFANFYKKIHGDVVIPDLMKKCFIENVSFLEKAKENLSRYNLLKYVNLIGENFNNIRGKKYDFIFCDAMHNPIEIRENIYKMLELSSNSCKWAIHDINGNTRVVCDEGNATFLKKVNGLGVFHINKN